MTRPPQLQQPLRKPTPKLRFRLKLQVRRLSWFNQPSRRIKDNTQGRTKPR
uniref:Uncharacterized protein n=1 Tax=Oryza sativa subsp. japonica TaxID=39947 RepID=Q6H4J8_ORYSJ|nr:hypothetical protein [Oryza sativa Japonica Group]